MAASYKYSDVIRTLELTGFELIKNNGGSHQAYYNKYTGLKQMVPRHSNGTVAGGTAECALDSAVLSAYILNINIGTEKSGLPQPIVEYIRKQHAHIKQDPMSMVPKEVRLACGLDTPEKVKEYIKDKIRTARRQYEQDMTQGR